MLNVFLSSKLLVLKILGDMEIDTLDAHGSFGMFNTIAGYHYQRFPAWQRLFTLQIKIFVIFNSNSTLSDAAQFLKFK